MIKLTDESLKIPTTIAAYAFGSFLSGLLLKYVLYDNGFTFANLLLVASVTYVRWFLLKEKSSRFQDSASLILFILIDRSLLGFGNILILLGVACIRKQFHMVEIAHICKLSPKNPFDAKKCPACTLIEYKEALSLTCGLTLALLGWYSTGRILVIYALIVFFYYYSLFISMFWVNLIHGLFTSCWKFFIDMFKAIKQLRKKEMN